MLSFDLQLILQKATEKAAKENHEFVTLEHILEQFCLSKEGQDFLSWANVPMQPILIETQDIIKKHCSTKTKISGTMPELTVGLHRCINSALNQAQSAGKKTIQSCNVLISFFDEDESFAVYVLDKNKIEPILLMNYLTAMEGSEADDESIVEKYTLHLNHYLKEHPQQMIGRTKELESLHRTLLRKSKNHSLILGASGVGKTTFVMGFVQSLIDKKAPSSLKKAQVYSLNMGALMAGTKYRGDLEARINKLFKELEKFETPIVFIDEIHNLVGAGRTSGSNSDISNLLKPFLEKSKIRFIGATTYQDYRKNLDSEPAFTRRFQQLEIEEPNKEECLQIVSGLVGSYEKHHKVTYDKDVPELSIALSGKHLHDRKWPDKALDVLDEAGSMTQLENKKVVVSKIIEKVIASMAKIPEETAEQDEVQLLKNLDEKLKSKIFGQDSAVEELVASIQYSRSGLGPKEGPIGSFLFTGPTGVGKTEVSKNLASQLGVKFIKFDMSEYMEKHSVSKLIGAPPGYVGFDDGGQLTSSIRENPHSLLLLDEIEKAHPDLLNVLLQVMDSGVLTDSKGKSVNFSNVIIIMTSNLGAREASKNRMGLALSEGSVFSDEAVKKFFSPEFINRLTGIIKFGALSKDRLKMVIEKFMSELKDQVSEKDFQLSWDQDVIEFILEKGFDPLMGARPYQRTINQHIKKLLVSPLLFGTKKENKLHLYVDEGKIVFK